MRILVGLGNPGPKHAENRHNIGYMAADEIVRRYDFIPTRARFNSYVFEGRIAGEKIVLLKPKTFMNESGRAVWSALQLYKLKARDVIVFYDELDLVAGKVRVKKGGGTAGHNGLRSIESKIGKDFWRVRLGIGHPGKKSLVQRHVLGDFTKDDHEWVEKVLDAVAQAVPLMVEGDDAGFMNQVALLNPPPKKPKKKKPSEDEQAAEAEQG